MSKTSEAVSVNSHFDGKDPVVQRIYERILSVSKAMGPLVVEPKKTSIHLVRTTAFAGISTRRMYLILTIKSDRQIKSSRIHKSQHTSANRFHHETRIEKPADVDAEVIGWLKSAYALSA